MRVISMAAVLLQMVAGGSALAATPAQVCSAAKTAAAGTAAYAKAKCEQAALTKGTGVDPVCLAKADAALEAAFAKAEAKGGCASAGDAPAITGFVDGCIVSYRTAITGDPLCAAGKTKATGKNTLADATCTKKATLKGAPLDAACTTKASAKLTKDFAKADTKGVCTGTAPEMLAIIDACVAQIVVPAEPTTTSSTTSSSTTSSTTTSSSLGPLACDFHTSDECIDALVMAPNLANCFNQCVNFRCVVPCGEDCPDPVACGQCLRDYAPFCTSNCCP